MKIKINSQTKIIKIIKILYLSSGTIFLYYVDFVLHYTGLLLMFQLDYMLQKEDNVCPGPQFLFPFAQTVFCPFLFQASGGLYLDFKK